MSLMKEDTDVAMRDADTDVDRDDGDSEAGTTWSAHSDALSDSTEAAGSNTRDHRRKSVYDAVAGRVRIREPRPPKWPGQPIKYRHTTLTPEDALFRAAGAPERFEETDTYFAHADLAAGVLPESDLVKAVHHYASHFYEALELREVNKERGDNKEKVVSTRRRLLDERSMDETALLAFGILLEEAGRAVLGADGALVFTEAAEDSEEDEDEGEWQTEDELGVERGG